MMVITFLAGLALGVMLGAAAVVLVVGGTHEV